MIDSLVMCFDYSTGAGTVNTGASVMIRLRLHLTASGVVTRVVGIRNENLFSIRPAG
jgi:hypothetical protein